MTKAPYFLLASGDANFGKDFGDRRYFPLGFSSTGAAPWSKATPDQVIADIQRAMTALGVPETRPPVLDKPGLLSGVSIFTSPPAATYRDGV